MPASRIAAALVALVLAGGLCSSVGLTGAAATETATSIDLLVGTDGVHFSPELDGGLFAESGLLVPGDSVASDLWIKNPTAARAVLRVSARGVVISSSDLADGMTMSVWNSGTDTSRSATLGRIAECQILVPPQTIAPGATMKMIFRYTMADLAGVAAQRASTSVGIMVAIRDAEAGAFPQSACDDDGVLITSMPVRSGSLVSPSSLARTGTDRAAPLLATGAFLVGIGLFMVAGRRRKRNES